MPDTLTTPTRAGLFTTADVPVPLTGVSVVADIVNLCSRVTITQRFVNRESQPIEAVYLFPLDEGAAVCGFEVLSTARWSSVRRWNARRPSRSTTTRCRRATAHTCSTKSGRMSSRRASATCRRARKRC